jgi:hypothetical protein
MSKLQWLFKPIISKLRIIYQTHAKLAYIIYKKYKAFQKDIFNIVKNSLIYVKKIIQFLI